MNDILFTNEKLLEVLGIPMKGIAAVSIDMQPRNLPTVTITTYPRRTAGEPLLQRFELTALDRPKPSVRPFDLDAMVADSLARLHAGIERHARHHLAEMATWRRSVWYQFLDEKEAREFIV